MGWRVTKDPDAVLFYGVDWSDWLGEGETIATSEWLLPEGDELVNEADFSDNITTTIKLSGGVAGQDYIITNRIETSAGQTDDRSITILCRNR